MCTLSCLMTQYTSSSNGLGNLAVGRSGSGWSYSRSLWIFDLILPHRKASSPGEEDPDAPKNLIYVVVHGIDIEPPVPIAYKTSIVGTRAEAAHKAHLLLQDELGPYAMNEMCTCKIEETKKFEEAADGIVDEDALDP